MDIEGIDPRHLRNHVLNLNEEGAPRIRPVPQKPSGRKKAQKVHRAERMARLAALYGDGQTLKQIAAKTGLSISYVSEEINNYITRLEQGALESLSKRISQSEATFRLVQTEATLAWYNSMNPTKTYTQKKVKEIKSGLSRKFARRRQINEELEAAFADIREDGETLEEGATPDGETEEVTHQRRTTCGDPRFLQIIIECEKNIIALRRLIPKDGADATGWAGGLGADEVRRLGAAERRKLLLNMKERAQLRKAQQLALGAGEQDYIEVGAQVRDVTPEPVLVQQPATVTVAAEDDWL